jgi:hypothetical protein
VTAPDTPRYRLPFGDFDAALTRLDTIIRGGWSPRIAGMVKSTRTYAYHGGFALDGEDLILIPDGTIVIPDNTAKYIQRTPEGDVSADDALDLATKIPMAYVETLMGELVHFEDIRDSTEAALLTGGPIVKGEGSTVTDRTRTFNFVGATVEQDDTDPTMVHVTIAGEDGAAAGGDPALAPDAGANTVETEYFSSGSALDNAKWTAVNKRGGSDVIRRGRLLLTAQSHGSVADDWYLETQPAPSGSFTIQMRAWPTGGNLQFGAVGILIRRGASGNFALITLAKESALHFSTSILTFMKMTSVTTPSTVHLTRGVGNTYEGVHLQLRYDGTDIYFDYSHDGINYDTVAQFSASTEIGGAPDQIGVGVNAPTSAGDVTAVIDHFKCYHDAALQH